MRRAVYAILVAMCVGVHGLRAVAVADEVATRRYEAIADAFTSLCLTRLPILANVTAKAAALGLKEERPGLWDLPHPIEDLQLLVTNDPPAMHCGIMGLDRVATDLKSALISKLGSPASSSDFMALWYVPFGLEYGTVGLRLARPNAPNHGPLLGMSYLYGRMPDASVYAAERATDSKSSDKRVDPLLLDMQGRPVTVFDLGLQMLWRDLAEIVKGNPASYGRLRTFPPRLEIRYLPHQNEIWVVVESDPPTGRAADDWCKSLVASLRHDLKKPGMGDDPAPFWMRYFVPPYDRDDRHSPSAFGRDEVKQLYGTFFGVIFVRGETAEHLTPTLWRRWTCTGSLFGDKDTQVWNSGFSRYGEAF